MIIFLLLTAMFFTNTATMSYAWDKFSGDKFNIVVTIEPLAQFVEKICADSVEVEALIPRGADPHTFAPKPKQLKKFAEAELLIKVGSGLEFENVWIEKLLSSNKDLILVNSSAGIKFIAISNSMEHSRHKHNRNPRNSNTSHSDQGHGKNDPHIWLSPANAIIMVENIYEGIVKVDKINQQFYESNKNRYIKELLELDEFIKDAVTTANIKHFMAYHPAWGYYANEYGLEQISIEVEGKEPSIKSIRNAVETAKKNNIRVIFASPELSTSGPELIAREINGKTALISPLEKMYLSNLYEFTETLTGIKHLYHE